MNEWYLLNGNWQWSIILLRKKMKSASMFELVTVDRSELQVVVGYS